MKYRYINSLGIAAAFVAIALTGLSLYLGLKTESVEVVHSLFGLLFVYLAVQHIRHNLKAIRNYTTARRERRRISKEAIMVGLVSAVLLALMCSRIPAVDDAAHAGRTLIRGPHDRNHRDRACKE